MYSFVSLEYYASNGQAPLVNDGEVGELGLSRKRSAPVTGESL